VLAPTRTYLFSGAKPQVDHIVPLRLKGSDEVYKKNVDVIWNFQPMPAGVNNFKRARHPYEFFQSEEGRKHIGEYDYLPPLSDVELWMNEKRFIWRRKLKMLRALKARYALTLSRA
jgi:hypothetical protein